MLGFRKFINSNRKKCHIAVVLCFATAVMMLLPGSAVGTFFSSSSAKTSGEGYTLKFGKPGATKVQGGVTTRNLPEGGVFREGVVKDYRSNKAKKLSGPSMSVKNATTADPYLGTWVDGLGEMMSTQLTNYFTNSTGERATVSTVLPESFANRTPSIKDINSSVTFTFSTDLLPNKNKNMTSADILPYIEQAISRYPRLCCLFTLVYLEIYDNQATMTVYSPVKKDDLYKTTLEYEAALDDILKVPTKNASMNIAEKLLYLHDEVCALTEYAYRSGLYAMDFTPVGAMIYNSSVCQAYAAVFNQAARKLGFTCYVVDSDIHAWNAVKINNYWYYIDTTYDDTVSGKDALSHKNFLFKEYTNHQLESGFYETTFSGITGSNMGSAYDNYFPKAQDIPTQMGYLGGYFYFVDKNCNMFRWSGSATKAEAITTVPGVLYRRASVCGEKLYISGNDGLYECNDEITYAIKLSNSQFKGMYEAAAKLYLTTGGSWSIYKDYSTPASSPTPGPTGSIMTPTPVPSASASATASATANATASASPTPTGPNIPTVPPSGSPSTSPTPTSTPEGMPIGTPTPTPKVTTPAQTKITSIKNVKTRSVKLKWKSVSTTRYRIEYSTKSNFSAPYYYRDVLTNSVKVTNLYKNKTYYFRVRGVKIRNIDGKLVYKYGKWSKKRKVKIKK